MTLGDTPLTADEPLPHRPRRVLVTGCSGSGKTTPAAALAVRLGIPHQELDALFHGPGWVPRPTFVAEVTALAATESWVVEWQYDQVRSLLLARADLLVWLGLSRTRVFVGFLRPDRAARTGRPRAARPPGGRAAPQPSGDPAVARSAGLISSNPTFSGFDHRKRRSRVRRAPAGLTLERR